MNSYCQKVFDLLNSMNISYDLIEHPAVFTIEDMDKLNFDNKDKIVKNLFVRDDKKQRYFLVVVQKNKRVDLKKIRENLNCRPLCFASEKSLDEFMNLNKGSVTPFGVLNDDECKVEVVFDKEILSFEQIGVHPNDNTATVFISPQDLELIIRNHGNKIYNTDI